jgi:hypothetical protein
MELHDGVRPVKKIAVMSIFRDNEHYLQTFFFRQMVAMEKSYDVEFDYFFLENNSKDRTNGLLEEFLKGRRGRLVTFDLNDIVNKGINFERTSRLAFLRNSLMDFVAPVEATYCLLIDSDIFFDVTTLRTLFAHKPREKNIGLLGPFAKEGILGSKLRQLDPESFKDVRDNDMMMTPHYYDTFAYIDSDGNNYWPKCPFKTCKFCPHQKKDQESLMYVKSCFGGFTLLDADIVNNHRKYVRWATFNFANQYSSCEHLLFNAALQARTGMKVAIAGDADGVFWTG